MKGLYPEYQVDHSTLPWFIHYPHQIPNVSGLSDEVFTIDAYSNTKFMSRDIVVGRALPDVCAEPNIRPLVRATIVNLPQGQVMYTYMPSRYGKDPMRNGESQIPVSQVEYLSTFFAPTEEESKAKIKAALTEKSVGRVPEKWEKKGKKPRGRTQILAYPDAHEEQAQDYTIVDTYSGSNYLAWDIMVGHARPHVCADPGKRPLVRATLGSRDQVMIFMPARYSNDALRTNGEVQVHLNNVDIYDEFDAPSEVKRRDKIRTALLRKKKDKLDSKTEGDREAEDLEECRGVPDDLSDEDS